MMRTRGWCAMPSPALIATTLSEAVLTELLNNMIADPEQRRFLESRFWRHVDQSGGPDGCWPWTGNRGQKGYGRVICGGNRLLAAHRVSLALHSGPIPSGICACHHCDNPACVNPTHIFRGTNEENTADKIRKGRARYAPPRGSKVRSSKLTEETVSKIKRDDRPMSQIAKDHGVSYMAIYYIKKGLAWRHVA